MPFPLSPAERDTYRKRGFFVREAALEPAELVPLREAVEYVHDRIVHARTEGQVEQIDGKRYQRVLESTVKWEWQEGSAEVRSMEPFHHLDPRLPSVIDDPRIWGPAADLLGESHVSLFTDKLNFKRPHGSPFPWHQDTPYWAFGCEHTDRLASVQIYLDTADRANGCLWMIPGSHLRGALPSPEDRGRLGRLYTDVSRLDGEQPFAIEAPAGSLVFFHGDVVHGSRSNRSARSRRAFVLTYQPPGHTRWNRKDIREIPAAT